MDRLSWSERPVKAKYDNSYGRFRNRITRPYFRFYWVRRNEHGRIKENKKY